MNTIFFQVRPNNDAFYESEYNDWSEFLVGRGVNPGWDPLKWMIEVTHERDMYFQCWMNAFRVTVQEQFPDNDAIAYSDDVLIAKKAEAIGNLSAKNFAKQHPEYVLMGDYDSKLILNPAEPAVHEHLLNTIGELITKYDVDGFHFDDYFYPDDKNYKGLNAEYKKYTFSTEPDVDMKDYNENVHKYNKDEENLEYWVVKKMIKDINFNMSSNKIELDIDTKKAKEIAEKEANKTESDNKVNAEPVKENKEQCKNSKQFKQIINTRYMFFVCRI